MMHGVVEDGAEVKGRCECEPGALRWGDGERPGGGGPPVPGRRGPPAAGGRGVAAGDRGGPDRDLRLPDLRLPLLPHLDQPRQRVVQTAVTAVIATGMTMVIITAGIDLSVGSVAALAGVLGTKLMVQADVAWPLAVIVGSAVGLACGLGNGLLVTRASLAPFIATLGLTRVARGDRM